MPNMRALIDDEGLTVDALVSYSRPHRAFIGAVIDQVRLGNYSRPLSFGGWRDLVMVNLANDGLPSWGGRYHLRAHQALFNNAHGATVPRTHSLKAAVRQLRRRRAAKRAIINEPRLKRLGSTAPKRPA